MSSTCCLWQPSTLTSQEYILHNGLCGHCHLLRVCSTRWSVWTLSTSPPQEWTLHGTLPGSCPLSFLRVFSALVPLLITHSHSWGCPTLRWGKCHLFFYSILCVSSQNSLNGHQRTRKLREGQDEILVAKWQQKWTKPTSPNLQFLEVNSWFEDIRRFRSVSSKCM